MIVFNLKAPSSLSAMRLQAVLTSAVQAATIDLPTTPPSRVMFRRLMSVGHELLVSVHRDLGSPQLAVKAVCEYYAALVCLHVGLPEDVGLALEDLDAATGVPLLPHGRAAIKTSIQGFLGAAAAGCVPTDATLNKADIKAAMAAVGTCIPDLAAGRGSFLTASDQACLTLCMRWLRIQRQPAQLACRLHAYELSACSGMLLFSHAF